MGVGVGVGFIQLQLFFVRYVLRLVAFLIIVSEIVNKHLVTDPESWVEISGEGLWCWRGCWWWFDVKVRGNQGLTVGF